MTIYVGTSGWSYDHWKGVFYPEGLARHRWFSFYAARFNTVEINATFYHRFQDKTYEKWREQAPAGFRYTLKVPRLITHRRQLHDVAALVAEFDASAHLLGETLGMVLLQLPPNMPYQPQRLQDALNAFSEPSRVAVEFRDPRWMTEEVLTLLAHCGASLCDADYPGQALTGMLTGHYGYLRLHGRRQWYADPYSAEELAQIATTARALQSQGAKAVYVYFNNDFGGYAPANALSLMTLLGSHCRHAST